MGQKRPITITKEMAQAGPRFLDFWVKRARSTGECDRETAEQGFARLYSMLGEKRPPKIVWAPSPLKGYAEAARLVVKGTRFIDGHVTRMKNVVARMAEHVNQGVVDVIRKRLVEPADAAAGDIGDAIAAELNVRAVVISDKYPKLGNALSSLARNSFGPSLYAGHLAAIDYAGTVLGIQEYRAERPIVEAASAGWAWCFEGTVIACDHPTTLRLDENGKPHNADGPAIVYTELLDAYDFEVFCWHGTRVPFEALTPMSDVEWQLIEGAVDPDVRKALAEIKTEKWSKRVAPEKKDETDAERLEAAAAVERLGGLGALRDLTESG